MSMFTRLGLNQLWDKSSWAKDREESIKRKQKKRNKALTKRLDFKFVWEGKNFIIRLNFPLRLKR